MEREGPAPFCCRLTYELIHRFAAVVGILLLYNLRNLPYHQSMNRKLRQNIIMMLVSILVSLLGLEGMARCCLPVSNPPLRHSTDLGLQREPGQDGQVVTFLGEMHAHYHVNAAGWNSSLEYQPGPHPDTYRIAVIGDSFVEALQVDADQAYPDLLAARLPCRSVETYRFGIGGAPLSQYVVTLRYVLETYQPDLVLVQLVGNDYDESIAGYEPWGPLFWRISPAGSGYELVPPATLMIDERARAADQISALRRFLQYNLSISLALLTPTASAEVPHASDGEVFAATDWLLAQLRDDAQAHGIPLILLMEPDRDSIYAGSPEFTDTWGDHAHRAAASLKIPIIDLGPAQAADYQQHGQPFEFPHDAHWNAYAHQIVADAVAREIEPLVCH